MEKQDIKTEAYTPLSSEQGKVSIYTKKDIDDKFKDTNYILLAVVVLLLVMVATLVIDSFHINSAIYKEYSEKNTSIDETQKINNELLKSNQILMEQVKGNQELIKKLLTK